MSIRISVDRRRSKQRSFGVWLQASRSDSGEDGGADTERIEVESAFVMSLSRSSLKEM